MKYTDVSEIFSRRRASVVVMTTYDFDPLYFEHKLLRTTAFDQARRILIFMDAGRYAELCQSNVHTRYLNDRYLVAPVQVDGGVFHPKLQLLMRKTSATVMCGSNNITQGGFTSNLEVFNALDIEATSDNDSSLSMVRDVLGFYEKLAEQVVGPAKDVAKRWLRDLTTDFPWIPANPRDHQGIRLLHTLNGSLLDQLMPYMAAVPDRVLIVSPFYDKDLRLLKRLQSLWPECKFELVAQERTSTLPVAEVAKLGDHVALYRLHTPNQRRLHAKLLALCMGNNVLCFSGSANFTSAAFDGSNVEACFLLNTSTEAIDALFDSELKREQIAPNQFDPGEFAEPSVSEGPPSPATLRGVKLSGDGVLHIDYEVNMPDNLAEIRLWLCKQNEQQPFHSIPLSVAPAGHKPAILKEDTLKQIHGTILCTLRSTLSAEGAKHASSVWLIQERRLTHEFTDRQGAGSERERIIRETGRGTMEYLDIIAEREGIEAVIEFLRRLNIKYQASYQFSHSNDIGHYGIHDPSMSDDAPEWVRAAGKDLDMAVRDFVDRHHKYVLTKHARGGNVNGLSNFIDVFVECNKLLFVYSQRGVVKPLYAMDLILRGIGLATSGYEWLNERFPGYITNVMAALQGEDEILRSALKEVYAPEHVLLAMSMAQVLRWSVKKEGNPNDFLNDAAMQVQAAFSSVGIAIDEDSLDQALMSYPGAIADNQRLVDTVRKSSGVGS